MFFAPETPEIRRHTENFANWLMSACQDRHLDEDSRYRLLAQWDKAPGARFSHPREEHLLPLHACYGMAGTAADDAQLISIMGKKAAMFHWAL
jgi:aromatic ring-opening dioxygenase catalytic subunit (LigB family)